MRCLSLQLPPEHFSPGQAEALIQRIKSMGRFPEIDRPGDNQGWLILNFFTDEATVLWEEIRTRVFDDPELGAWLQDNAVVICEKEPGSPGHLLLHSPEADARPDRLTPDA